MTNNHTTAPSPAYSVDQARQAVLATIPSPTATEQVELADALNRVSARNINAIQNIPPFQNSAMDGYALRARDTRQSTRFKVAGTSLAGHPFTGDVPPGFAVKITTGAVVPPSTDCIVIVENTSIDGDDIVINKLPEKGQFIRNAGDDTESGTLLVPANRRMTPSDLGLIAAQGVREVKVFKLPAIGVFSTGDELCTTEQPLHGQIYDSNRVTIQSLIKNAGFATIDLGVAKDSEEDIQAVLKKGSHCDFILSSGGVSVGEADFVKTVLEANGELTFWKVAMKPGKPMVTGKLKDGAIYFGLPGNPVSSMVTCLQFVIPAIQAFCGQRYTPPKVLQARCATELHKEVGRFEFQRGIATLDNDGKLTVSTTGLQDSHVLTSMSNANCLICLESESDGVKQGSETGIILFDSLSGL